MCCVATRIAKLSLALSVALLLPSCGSRDPDQSADAYASRVGGPAAGSPGAATAKTGAALPQPAPNGRQAVTFAAPYSQVDPYSGAKNGLTINRDGTFELIENGQATRGTYTWLRDGKRLRLNGVATRPIVLIANGAIYRLTNENVPLDDLTPDRMYSPSK
jgi:hypothetical protein